MVGFRRRLDENDMGSNKVEIKGPLLEYEDGEEEDEDEFVDEG